MGATAHRGPLLTYWVSGPGGPPPAPWESEKSLLPPPAEAEAEVDRPPPADGPARPHSPQSTPEFLMSQPSAIPSAPRGCGPGSSVGMRTGVGIGQG